MCLYADIYAYMSFFHRNLINSISDKIAVREENKWLIIIIYIVRVVVLLIMYINNLNYIEYNYYEIKCLYNLNYCYSAMELI